MRYAQSSQIDPVSTTEPVSIRQLRLWSAPQLIMIATNLADELTILPHAIFQARQSSAKILLVHVVSTRRHISRLSQALLQQPTNGQQAARSVLDRIAQQLRWVGIPCEAVVLTGGPEIEIPRFAKARNVDRLIVAFEDSPDLTTSRSGTLLEQLLPAMEIPVCVIGRHAGLSSPNGLRARAVTLAVSLDSDCQIQVGFASRFAQEAHANLSILHVCGRERVDLNTTSRTPVDVISELPHQARREAELFCPIKVDIREGDPAEEILRHSSSGSAGPIVLCSSGKPSAGRTWRNSVTYRVLLESRYPVFILEKRVTETADILMFPDNVPVVGRNPECIGSRVER